MALAAFAGLRLGEAAAIQVGDIDFLRKKLAVARQVQRAAQGSVELRPPKCGSERTVFLAPELVELLASHIACNGVGPEPASWIFRGDGEDPPHQNTIGHRWRRTLTRAGVSGVRLHDLRHYFASGLIAAGCDVVTVQRALGHARATTTLNTYSHLWPSAEDRTREADASLMLESAGQYRATGATASL
jgi:integrase